MGALDRDIWSSELTTNLAAYLLLISSSVTAFVVVVATLGTGLGRLYWACAGRLETITKALSECDDMELWGGYSLCLYSTDHSQS